ncbi:MAG TPA: hypothetical protein VF543_22310 [Pyrinomonadaceae bacterium]|jgi:hypothetical protein
MRESLVQIYDNPEDGFEYGRVFKSSDFMKGQDYAHAHINSLARDYLLAGAPSARVAGFGYALAGGLSLTIHKGEAVDPNGLHYETFPAGADVVVATPAADVANPRIDLIVAVLAADQGADILLLPHRRLLSELEIQAGVDPGDPQDFNVPTERRNTATIAVRPGVAGVAPVAPAAGVNEVPLYQVRVEAGAVVLTAPKVTDVRPLARSLYNAWAQVDAINASPAIANLNEAIDDRVNGLLVDSTYFTKVYDDAGNLLTLDADLAAFDARYVNVTGDTMTGQLNVTKRAVGAGVLPVGDAAFVAQNNNTADGQTNYGVLGAVGGGFGTTSAGVYGYSENQGGGAPAVAIGVKGKAFVSHYDASAYGGYFDASGSNLTSGAKVIYGLYAKGLTQGDNLNGIVYGGYFVADNSSTQINTVYGIYAKAQGAGPGTKYAGYFDGNVYINGNLTSTLNIALGVINAATGALSSTVTWNNAGVTFSHWKANVTDTASAAASLFLDFQLAGVSQFSVRKDGLLTANGGSFNVGSGGMVQINPGGSGAASSYLQVQDRARFGYDGSNSVIRIDDAATSKDFAYFSNNVEKFRVTTNGLIKLDATVVAAGTTGAQTINKASGRVNFAAGTSQLVVTNSLVTTNSIIICVLHSNDATAQIKNVVPAGGSFTINLTANATAETKAAFLVINT